jgi:ribA/ribD-fused uncharacterized protein
MPIVFKKVSENYGWLGNMSAYAVTYLNKEWRTTEALFQALRFADEGIQEKIRAEKSPMAAKMRAKNHADSMTIEPMSAQDVINMELVIRLKVQQHPELRQNLLATGDEIIIEDVTGRKGGRHQFWGMAKQNEEWVGENTLGNIWMKIRSEIQTERGNA